MHLARKRKLTYLLLVMLLLSAATALILYALRQNISLFYTPTQVVQGEAAADRPIRVGGMVVKNSIQRGQKGLRVQFTLTDFEQQVVVNYEGILPDLFREGQGVVVTGQLDASGQIKASQVLAKHDENYMPPELKSVLKNKGKGDVG